MGRIVGIDLGTTYSAVAIPEERGGEGLLAVRGCPGCSVVMDRLKRRITPSVVAEDDRGNIVVGHTAKGRAGLSPEPIMFAKRYMGEDKTYALGKQGELRPHEVSGHILRALKEIAEARLGEEVDEAVITVPAYFSLKAKQMTEEAGKLAGLKVAQLAAEPVAAALMYCAGDDRDPLRVMTYDLGGGTFDVAVIEKRDGAISGDSIIASDGDRFLGGYDFDKALAYWMLDQLGQIGYDLSFEDDDPAGKIVFAKLLVYAERAKIELSRSPSHQFQEPSTGIKDRAGEEVVLDFVVTREDFEGLIRGKVEHTVGICRRALEEMGDEPIPPESIGEILMVGGSSRIPLIGRRLEEEFGRKPKLVEPDLCVALGAALIAGTKAGGAGCLKLDPVPAETELPSLTVTGRLEPAAELAEVVGCEVKLAAADGSYSGERKTGPDGGFLFDAVPLAPGDTTDFTLSALSPDGRQVASHSFSVRQTDTPKGGLVESVPNVLSKPLGILLVDGVHVIAPERTPLPFEKVVPCKTMDASGQLRVPIVDGNQALGEIQMDDLPTTLEVGSTVEVTLTIQPNYQVLGRAYIPAVAREATVAIDVPLPPVKTIAELQSEFELLEAQAQDALQGAGKGVLFGDARAKRLKTRLDDARGMLSGRGADPYAIQDCLDEIASLVRALTAGWKPEPPKAVFDQKAADAAVAIADLTRAKPATAHDGYDKRLDAIKSEAEKAYASQNAAAWAEADKRLGALAEEVERQIQQGTGAESAPPDPAQILLMLERDLANLAGWIKAEGRYEAFRQEFEALAADLKKIDPKAPDAMTQIRDWYSTKFLDFRKRLEAPDGEDLTGRLGLDAQK